MFSICLWFRCFEKNDEARGFYLNDRCVLFQEKIHNKYGHISTVEELKSYKDSCKDLYYSDISVKYRKILWEIICSFSSPGTYIITVGNTENCIALHRQNYNISFTSYERILDK